MNQGFGVQVADSASTAPLGKNRPRGETKQADRRGGVWSMGEVLAELLPLLVYGDGYLPSSKVSLATSTFAPAAGMGSFIDQSALCTTSRR